jgi:hypothetical protein
MWVVETKGWGRGQGMRRWLCCELITVEALKRDLLSLYSDPTRAVMLCSAMTLPQD